MFEAQELGAMSLFGEKYGDLVRVIKFGESVELCGGCHVKATGQIGLLKIVSEGAIAAGVRRIEAITAERAEKYINEQLELIKEVKNLLKGSKNIRDSIVGLLDENASFSKQVEKFTQEQLKIVKKNLKSLVLLEKGVNIIATKVELEDADAIKDLAFQLKNEVDDLFLVLGADLGGKPHLTVMISENIVQDKGLNAGQIVREAGREFKGGEEADSHSMQTAGGKDVNGIQAAIEKALSFIE